MITKNWVIIFTSENIQTEKTRNCKSFWIFLFFKPCLFQKHWLLSSIRSNTGPFPFRKKVLICFTMNLVFCNVKLIGQNSQKLKVVIIRLDNQTVFLSEQVSRFLPSMSQSTSLFLWKMIHYPYLLYPSIFRKKMIWLNCHFFVNVECFLILEQFFSIATGCNFSSWCPLTSFRFWNALIWETSHFFVLSGNLIDWQYPNMHKHVVLLEISTHLSPKLPTILLPSSPIGQF